jgi:hypothetical protein
MQTGCWLIKNSRKKGYDVLCGSVRVRGKIWASNATSSVHLLLVEKSKAGNFSAKS